ncbi:MAG: ribulose-phosphate 3-epimerase, partial [Hyphomicrobiales bacterium]|nr:ribulose-phosphate 3-epimerase [Hyphomicrobiales bacterium]
MSVKVAPSILAADFSRLGDEVRAMTSAGADSIHIDVMDGHFVPNLTIGAGVVKALRGHSKLPFDAHLMIAPVERHLDAFVEAGSDIISVHPESGAHLHRSLARIREAGCRAGVVLNPGTPLSSIESVIADVDMILVMTVDPGFGGQTF